MYEFQLFINRVNVIHPICAICVNECWIRADSDLSSLNLPNYNMFCLRGNREEHVHCGLVTYVHEQYISTNVILNQESTAWDYLCIEMSHSASNSNKYLLCNIYRLPGVIVDEFKLFVDEFSSLLSIIGNLKHSTFFVEISISRMYIVYLYNINKVHREPHLKINMTPAYVKTKHIIHHNLLNNC